MAVEASPINPSDLGVLLGAVAPGTLRPRRVGSRRRHSRGGVVLYRDRLDKPLPVGNEGAGTVIAAGPEAAALIGRRVALFGGSMWADYRVADAAAVVELPDDVSTAEGAALFINPLTALSMVETMRAEGHTALVHTAAASNLGQMLVRICAADGIGLVNIVRRSRAGPGAARPRRGPRRGLLTAGLRRPAHRGDPRHRRNPGLRRHRRRLIGRRHPHRDGTRAAAAHVVHAVRNHGA